MDDHLRMLLANIAAFHAGRVPEEEIYVFWGKVRSPQRMAPRPHLGEILAIDQALEREDGRELHLYLTDYRSLTWGTCMRSRLTTSARTRARTCRGIAVIAELPKLRNPHYDDRPVSL